MIHETFFDHFAQKNNYLTRIDARTKMVFVPLAIIITLSSTRPYVPVLTAFLSLAFLLSIRISPKIIIFRLIAPLSMAIGILFLRIFFSGYKEGLFEGMLIAAKVVGCTSLVIFLSMTTAVNALLAAARWFRIPAIWIEVTMLSYRYIFVLIEDAVTLRDAQKVRLGYSNISRSLRSSGELAGSLIIRAYDQSIATYESMCLRGFPGTGKRYCVEKLTRKDGVHGIIMLVILSMLLLLNIRYGV